MEIQLRAKGLYRFTMDTEIEPNHVVDKARYWNNMDEAFGFLCLLISKDLHFHVTRLKNPKEIRDRITDLFDKQDDMRIYRLENELISLHPSNFETLNEFFIKFKNLVLQLKQCEVAKEDDQLILSILSKLGPDYLVFVSTFHTGKLTTPNWKMPSLDTFIKILTKEHDKPVQMGILRSSKYQALFDSGSKDSKGKGKQKNPKDKFDAPKPKEMNQQQEESSDSKKHKNRGNQG